MMRNFTVRSSRPKIFSSPYDIFNAVHLVKVKHETIEKVAKMYKIHPRTLGRYVKKVNNEQLLTLFHDQSSVKCFVSDSRQLFSNDLEEQLVDLINEQRTLLSIMEIRKLAFNFALDRQISRLPKTWKRYKMATSSWYYGFRKRHLNKYNVRTKTKLPTVHELLDFNSTCGSKTLEYYFSSEHNRNSKFDSMSNHDSSMNNNSIFGHSMVEQNQNVIISRPFFYNSMVENCCTQSILNNSDRLHFESLNMNSFADMAYSSDDEMEKLQLDSDSEDDHFVTEIKKEFGDDTKFDNPDSINFQNPNKDDDDFSADEEMEKLELRLDSESEDDDFAPKIKIEPKEEFDENPEFIKFDIKTEIKVEPEIDSNECTYALRRKTKN